MRPLHLTTAILFCFFFTVQCSTDDSTTNPQQIEEDELTYFGDASRINLPHFYMTTDGIFGTFQGDLAPINALVSHVNYLKTTLGETSDLFIPQDWWESCNDHDISDIDYINRECYALSYNQLASVEFVELIETETEFHFNYGLYFENQDYDPSFYYRLEANQNLSSTEGQHHDSFSTFSWSVEYDSLSIEQTRPNLPVRLITLSTENFGGHYKVIETDSTSSYHWDALLRS